jgi:hypothetical protein
MSTKKQLKKLKKRIKALEIEVFGEWEVVFEPDEKPVLKIVTDDNSAQLAAESGGGVIACPHNHTLISGDSTWCYKCKRYL